VGNKIFVSYKYSDRQVQNLQSQYQTTVRDYVDILQAKMERDGNYIYKGENDGEDLSSLTDATIGSKLGDKIFDSTITIVFISKGMKDNTPEKNQWIPWEISYSLREQSRKYQNSKTNAILAVVLPDNYNSYGYFMAEDYRGTTLIVDFLFKILRENMFNLKNKSKLTYSNGERAYQSYIHAVKWCDFINNINHYINIALKIRSHIDEYEIRKNV
jgi:hypothetical protein